MKRTIYIGLCILTLLLLGYTAYYAASHPVTVAEPAPPVVANTTEEIIVDKNTHVTTSGKKINVVESNPVGESLSTVTITPYGFSTNTPIILEVNKMTNSFYADLNGDSHEELIITTNAQGSGSFGDAFIFTTASETQLLPVSIPELTESDTEKGGLFVGYMGHDSFSVVNNYLTREFPTYTKTDTTSEPTGPKKSIIYVMSENNGAYSIHFEEGTTTPAITQ